jgi:enolase
VKISKIIAREIFDSRGMPTVECELILEDEQSVVASAPSGASKGSHEAVELRDGDKYFFGKGVSKAIANIETKIAPFLVAQELDAPAMDQMLIELDGTSNKSNLGANATLPVSMALFKAQAKMEQVELFEIIAWVYGQEMISLPVPMFNVINGGAHADNNLNIQEFMVVPIGSQSYRQAVEAAMMFTQELKEVLKSKGKSTAVGDEGGFASQFEDETDAFNCLMEALIIFDKKHQNVFALALDVAASQFYDAEKNKYLWHGDYVTSDDLISYYQQIAEHFPLYSLEDGLAEDDWDGWVKMTEQLGNKMQLVGDDIFVTNAARIAKGLELDVANAVLIKPNQAGTVTETLQAIKLCKEHALGTVISHRSGETNDSFIADLAVGTSAGQIKAGGCMRGERLAKYNRLLRIEDKLLGHLLKQINFS